MGAYRPCSQEAATHGSVCLHGLCRELKRKERLEKEMRDLRASLDARQQEIRDKHVAVQQSAEHVAKLQVWRPAACRQPSPGPKGHRC